MFSFKQKREISDAVQKLLRDTNHPELGDGKIRFKLDVWGESNWSTASITQDEELDQKRYAKNDSES